MRFSLRQLEVFLAVARHGNTFLAAEELNLSQSAVSAALNAFERSYDIALFDRAGKRLVLNDVGATMRQKAESLLAHAREFDQDLKGHEHIGHLKVGASFTIANYLAINYLAAYLQQHPSANVEIEAANSPEVIAQVMNYEVDIGMIEGGTNHPNLDLIPWIQDELTVFVSPDHPLAAKKQITDQDLKSARWIMRERDSGARKTFEQRFIKLLPQMEIYLEFRHNEAIKRAVESSLGVGCLSRIVLESSFREGNLVPLKLPQKYDLRRTFYFVLVKNRYVKRAAETWLNMCLEISHSG